MQAFHANAQHDTSVASQIALTSQRDGQITKGISTLGMLFLPGTYISVRSAFTARDDEVELC